MFLLSRTYIHVKIVCLSLSLMTGIDCWRYFVVGDGRRDDRAAASPFAGLRVFGYLVLHQKVQSVPYLTEQCFRGCMASMSAWTRSNMFDHY
jgi:hypothetical protein